QAVGPVGGVPEAERLDRLGAEPALLEIAQSGLPALFRVVEVANEILAGKVQDLIKRFPFALSLKGLWVGSSLLEGDVILTSEVLNCLWKRISLMLNNKLNRSTSFA